MKHSLKHSGRQFTNLSAYTVTVWKGGKKHEILPRTGVRGKLPREKAGRWFISTEKMPRPDVIYFDHLLEWFDAVRWQLHDEKLTLKLTHISFSSLT